MINFHNVTKKNIKEHNPNCSEIPDYLYRILIIRGSESGKDRNEAKYQFLIKKRESTGFRPFNDSKHFIEYLNDIGNIYENIKE